MDKVILKTQLSKEEYIKVSFYMLFRKKVFKWLIALFVLVFLMTLPSLVSDPLSQVWPKLLYMFLLGFGLPIMTYFTTLSNYNSNKRISEAVTYEFTDDIIVSYSESFNVSLKWDRVYAVTENKTWVLIWQNKQVANLLPKRDFQNNDLKLFKEIVSRQVDLENKLK